MRFWHLMVPSVFYWFRLILVLVGTSFAYASLFRIVGSHDVSDLNGTGPDWCASGRMGMCSASILHCHVSLQDAVRARRSHVDLPKPSLRDRRISPNLCCLLKRGSCLSHLYNLNVFAHLTSVRTLHCIQIF